MQAALKLVTCCSLWADKNKLILTTRLHEEMDNVLSLIVTQ
jgi:hypothetical protein